MTRNDTHTGSHASGQASSDQALAALFAQIAEDAADREQKRILPFDEIAKLRTARFGAYRLPREAGGAGASVEGLLEKVIALAAADSNVAHILRNHFVFVERFVRRPETRQARFWQEQIAAGAIFGLANTELAKARSGAQSVTRLTRENGRYRLDGEKFYSTGSLYADFVIVRAKDEADHALTVVIPTDREGIELVDDWDSTGQRMTGSGTTRFTHVLVEENEIIPDAAGTGYGRPYKSTLPQIFLTAVNAGILRSVLRDARALLHKRSNKGFFFAAAETPANDPLLLRIVGELSSHAFAAETLVLAAARAQDVSLDAGPDDLVEKAHHAAILATKAKLIVDEFVLKAGNSLFDLGGASSTLRDQNLDRHWRNARTVASHNPALYKALAIGRLEVHGTPLPDKDFF